MIQNLMIGDWVRHANGTPMRVTAIKGEHFACGCPHCWSYNNEYSPIKITANFLAEMGLISEQGYGFILSDDLYLFFDKDEFGRHEQDKWVVCSYYREVDYGMSRQEFATIQYLHELQNILPYIPITQKAINLINTYFKS